VAVRVRPLVGKELSEGTKKECVFPPENDTAKTKLFMGGKSFNFDAVFWADEKQESIFDKCTRNLVLGCFHGYNATILAYGQTGSGKTHTMGTGYSIGVPFDEVGIVPRVFKFIFDEIELRRAQSEFSEFKVKIAFLELYNEELHDLMDPASMLRDKITGKPMKEL
jgi:kinesin family member 21